MLYAHSAAYGGVKPEDAWKAFVSPEGHAFYSNAVTNETTWQAPANVTINYDVSLGVHMLACSSGWSEFGSCATPGLVTHAQDAWRELHGADGRAYYFNAATQQSVWEQPDCLIKAAVWKYSSSIFGKPPNFMLAIFCGALPALAPSFVCVLSSHPDLQSSPRL